MSDLFKNPMVQSALRSMTPDQIEQYKKMGQYMYNSINYKDNEIVNSLQCPIEEALAYIVEGIKSGLHPIDLYNDECTVLIAAYGEQWYEKFGYTKNDLQS